MKKRHLLASLILSLSACGALAADQTLTDAQKKQIKNGAYLAQVGDCVACHTTPGGATFAGGLAMSTPIGDIYSTNITPDTHTGIGNYTLEDFDRAVRQGRAKSGHSLYPAMPYPSYTKITDSDLNDLYLYFMHAVTPVGYENAVADIPWPLNMRWPLTLWDTVFLTEGVYQPDPRQNDEWNRGAYLVQGLGHCGACHTPRGLGFQEKALDQRSANYLAGGTLEGWHAPNLNGDDVYGLGRWTRQEIIDFLQKGHNAHSAAFGSMTQVVEDSTQYFSAGDLKAVTTYLKSLPRVYPRTIFANDNSTYRELHSGQISTPGAQLYIDNCAACHRTDGKGYVNTFPVLDGNSVLNSEDPSSIIHIILVGGRVPVTERAPSGLVMPDFAWRLNDEEVAELSTFVRNAWSNRAPAVTAGEAKDIRDIAQR